MLTIYKLMFFVGYITLMGPPRAATLYRSETAANGELSKQPLISMMLTEYLLRGALLLGVFVAIEELLGKHYYELYRFDELGMLLVGFGTLHTVSSYLFLELFQPRLGWVGFRFYRLVRNLCYAPLPAVAVLALVLFWQGTQKIEPFSGEYSWQVPALMYLVMLVASVIEVLVVSRRPLGVDEAIEIKKAQ